MITAIIGRAGSGKSTISRLLSNSYDVYIEADKVAVSAYSDVSTIVWFREHKRLKDALVNGVIAKSLLVGLLIKFPSAKYDLEDYLYEKYLWPIIKECRLKNKSLLIDGIIPRLIEDFNQDFDQIISIEVSEELRRENLLKRGVGISRIEEINQLQTGFSGVYK